MACVPCVYERSTCDMDWGMGLMGPMLLMLCMLLMLKLRLCEEEMVWVGPIRSNSSAEAGAGARLGVMPPKRLLPLGLAADCTEGGIWPPGKAFQSPNSLVPLAAGTHGKTRVGKFMVLMQH